MRINTERPVTIKQGTNMLVSTDKAKKYKRFAKDLFKEPILKPNCQDFGMVKQPKGG